ncbi:MAG TPA: thiamine pyrophosphate-binding protein [Patescibacteria group bacterium]
MKISFSELLQKYLLSVGINKMYGIVGREDAILSFNTLKDFEFVLTRHEMTAGVMASAISSFTKSPQVCFGTLGPGITNYMTALATATMDRHPLVLIVAQMETPYIIHNDMHQCLDNVSIAKPLAKYTYELKSPKELKTVLESAFKASMTFPFGPSVISVPIDILSADIEIDPKSEMNLNKESILPSTAEDSNVEEMIKEAAKIIKYSKNPLIIAGNLVIKEKGLGKKINEFSKSTNIPMVTTYSAKGIIDRNSKLNYGVLSSYTDSVVEQRVNEMIFDKVDTIIFLGYDLCERHPFVWTSNSVPKTFININQYHNNIHRALNPKVNVIMKLDKSLSLLKHQLKGYKNKKLVDMTKVNKKIDSLLADKTEYKNGITHPQVMNALNNHYKSGFILANDIGMHRHLSSIFFKSANPEYYVTSEGLSSFGTGLALGMGAKIANPTKPVVMIAGDGGFHSNDGDIETAVRLGLKMLIIVLNSGSNALIERYQLKGKYQKINKKNTSFGKVDFALLAKANGCESGIAHNIKELNKLIEKADKINGPFLIEVPIHYPNHYTNDLPKI